jgi:hypothetical protein
MSSFVITFFAFVFITPFSFFRFSHSSINIFFTFANHCLTSV